MPRLPRFNFRCRELGLHKKVAYVHGKKKHVEQCASDTVKLLHFTLKRHGRDAALARWGNEISTKLARCGGAKEIGNHLTQATRRKGWLKRARFLRRNTQHQRDAQAAQAAARRRGNRGSPKQLKNKTARALRNACENEISLYETYLEKRHAKRPRVDWTQRPSPATEDEVEWYLLDTFHHCNNFREDDRTSQLFRDAVRQCKDSFVLWCCSVVLAVLPNWRWYEAFVSVACGSLVFDPAKVKAANATALGHKLTDVVSKWEHANAGKFWQPMPYITLATAGVSKPLQVARLFFSLKAHGRKLFDSVAAGAPATSSVARLSEEERETRSEQTLLAMRQSKTLTRLGFFTTYQALVSFAGVQGQGTVFLYDPTAHAVAGNGATGALRLFFPGLPCEGYGKPARRTQLLALRSLHARVSRRRTKLFGRSAHKWTLQAAEHTPCEYFKWRKGVVYFAKLWRVPLRGAVSCKGQRPRRLRRAVLKTTKAK